MKAWRIRAYSRQTGADNAKGHEWFSDVASIRADVGPVSHAGNSVAWRNAPGLAVVPVSAQAVRYRKHLVASGGCHDARLGKYGRAGHLRAATMLSPAVAGFPSPRRRQVWVGR